MNQATLLAVFAHPDDESFGPGGTLAKYADQGVDVHIAIATDGVAGSVAEGHEDALEKLEQVRAQELEAAVTILGATLHKLGYRDSGYINDKAANEHPEAFINANRQEAVKQVVALIRQIRPHVIITHDETGGYFHPDHIFCHEITKAAFHAAGDAGQFPDAGPPHQPQRLYYTAFSNRWVKFYTLLLRLRGKDPTKMGRNKDIDMTTLGIAPENIHAVVDYRHYWDAKKAAAAQHSSQGGGTSASRILPEWLQKRLFAKDTFIRAYPPAPNGHKEHDLFANVL